MTNTPLDDESPECRNLVVVCCHAIYTGDGKDLSESLWLLQSFQRSSPDTGKPGEHETFITHISAGTQALENDPKSLLIFSGGRTTECERSEAMGYAKVLEALKGPNWSGWQRVVFEEYATDSYQNLLFSILRFRECTGRYPCQVTVITHAFKERRFLELHARAIKWPSHRLRVQGINPPFAMAELQKTQAGELENAHRQFEEDPYGVGPNLDGKRKRRNWDPAVLSRVYLNVESNVIKLVLWRGGEIGSNLFPHALPWDESEGAG